MRNYILTITLLLFTLGTSFTFTGCRTTEETIDENLDTDGDGLPNFIEQEIGTDPENPDSDDDGLTDGQEHNEYETDPLNPDTDGDELSDGDEVLTHLTDPNNEDSDSDGLSDGDEVLTHRTDPLVPDTDDDGLNDSDEVLVHTTDPNNPDTDGDGFGDGQEIKMETDPLDPNDPIFISELNTVNFDFDRSNIDDRSARQLSENAEQLKGASNYRIRVDAFTDQIGDDQYNMRLSQRRASAVVTFYRENGISEDRIESRGLGKVSNSACGPDGDPDGQGCRADRRAVSVPLHPYPRLPAAQSQ